MSHLTTLRRPAAALLTSLALLAPAPSAQSASQTFIASEAFDKWGSTVAVVGDVDGDGLPDVAVGSPTASVTVLQFVFHNVGRVRVYSGLTGAVIHSWSGNAAGGTEFGFAIADAGDVDHDGFDDVLVSAPKDDGPATTGGQVRLYSGRTGGLLRTFYGLQTSARFGHSIDGGHDVDGDGTPDVLVGSPYRNLTGSYGSSQGHGQVDLFSGADGSLLWRLAEVKVTYSELSVSSGYTTIDEILLSQQGRSVAFLGDTANNGKQVVAVAAPESDYRRYKKYQAQPKVLQSSKDETGFVRVLEPFGDVIGYEWGDGSNNHLGLSLASLAGPVDFGALKGMAVLQDFPDGRIVSVYAVGDELDKSGHIQESDDVPLGTALSRVGDVDGDGFVDVLIGLPQTSNGFPIGIPQVGSARIYSGKTSALLQTFGSSEAGALLGSAVAGGDVNGDGLPDVLLGAPGHDGLALDTGVAYLHWGSDCAPAGTAYYGAGWPGTLGIPVIAVDALPVLGTTVGLSISNSRGVTTQAILLIGLDDLSVTVKGGTLLVDALLSLPLVLPPGTTVLPGQLPDEPAFCGLSLYTQAIEADPGASHGASFTRGLRLDLGE